MTLDVEILSLICEKIKTGEEENILYTHKFLNNYQLPGTAYTKIVGKVLKKHSCYVDSNKTRNEATIDFYLGLHTRLRLYYSWPELKLKGYAVIDNETTITYVVDGNHEEIRWRMFDGTDNDGFAKCVEARVFEYPEIHNSRKS